MASVLVVETGAIVANANTFVTVAQVVAYATARLLAFDADADVLEAAIVKAGDYLKNESRFRYMGRKAFSAQRMPWPRLGVTERQGAPISMTEIPWRVSDAQCELAVRALTTDLQPDLARGGMVQSERVDVLSTTYFPTAPSETMIQAAQGILAPLLRLGPLDPATPYQAVPAVLTPFADGDFTRRAV